MSLMAYFAKNSSIRLMVYGVGIAAAFMVTPHILRCMGNANYGIWVLISSLTPYFTLTNMASTSAISTLIAEINKKETSQNESLNESQRIFVGAVQLRLLALFCTLIMTAFYFILADTAYKNTVSVTAFGLSLFTFCGAFGLSTLLNVGQGILAGHMCWTVLSFTGMLRVLLSSAGLLFFLDVSATPEKNLLTMACINAASYLFESGVNLLLASKHITLPPARFYFTSPLHQELWRLGKGLFLILVGDILRNSTQVYLVGIFLSTGQVTFYALAKQILKYMADLFQSAFGIMTPYFSKLQAEKNLKTSQSTLLISIFLSYGASSIMTLGLIFYADVFFTRWLGPQYAQIHAVLIPMALARGIYVGSIPANGLIHGHKKPHLVAQVTLGEGLALTAISIPALHFYGLPGLGWSIFAMAFLFKMLWFPRQVCTIAQLSLKKYYGNIALAVIPSALAQSLYYYAIQDFVIPSYSSILLAGFGQTLVALLSLIATLKIR